MIPTFILFTKLHWVNTYKPLIVPTFFANIAYHRDTIARRIETKRKGWGMAPALWWIACAGTVLAVIMGATEWMVRTAHISARLRPVVGRGRCKQSPRLALLFMLAALV
jgi:hypothetical protein